MNTKEAERQKEPREYKKYIGCIKLHWTNVLDFSSLIRWEDNNYKIVSTWLLLMNEQFLHDIISEVKIVQQCPGESPIAF